MIDEVAGWLACPNCGSPLHRAGAALRCPAGHGFDIARQGYVSLLPPGARAAGDSPAMVAARAAFLAAGHYAVVADALAAAALAACPAESAEQAGPAGSAEQASPAGSAEQASPVGSAGPAEPAEQLGPAGPGRPVGPAGPAEPAEQLGPAGPGRPVGPVGPAEQAESAGPTGPARSAAGAGQPGCVLDIGAGTGYYLAAVLDRLPGRAGLALDASKFAARRAARAHPRIGAVTADAWRRLPVPDGAAALALNVFAPRNGAELWRVLRPGAGLLVITPGPGHLGELSGPLGLLAVDPRKEERLAAALGPWFDLAGRQPVAAALALDHPAVAAAVGMGPSARHVSPADLAARIALLPAAVRVTLSVNLWTFRRRDTGRQ